MYFWYPGLDSTSPKNRSLYIPSTDALIKEWKD